MKVFSGNLLRSICVSLAVAALTAVTVFIVSYLLVPVTGMRVEGEKMLPERAVSQAIPDHASLVTLNTWTLERKLKSNPWVEDVVVSRKWDSGIVLVQVEERRAVLDAETVGRKVVLAADGTELPGLGGADIRSVGVGEERLEEVVGAMKVLESSGVELESIEAVGSGGVRAKVGGNVVLFSGNVEPEQARALEDLMRKNPDANVFDLRSPERVVVGPEKEPRKKPVGRVTDR